MQAFHVQVVVYDPWANPDEVKIEHNITSTQQYPDELFDAIILAVAHRLLVSHELQAVDVRGVLYMLLRYLFPFLQFAGRVLLFLLA